jgi:hypothetical protein
VRFHLVAELFLRAPDFTKQITKGIAQMTISIIVAGITLLVLILKLIELKKAKDDIVWLTLQNESQRKSLIFAQDIINGQADTILELERERLRLGDDIGPCF